MRPPASSLEPLENRIAPAAFTVTTTADAGAGSLRQAMLDANATADADTIDFTLGGSGVRTITLATPLPAILHPVTVNGSSQPGYVGGAPLIELSGAGLPPGSHGFDVQAANTLILALTINHFSGSGIVLASTGSIVAANYIGTDSTGGGGGSPGNGIGITITGSENVVGGLDAGFGNVISANLGAGVLLSGAGADGNLIARNIIGLSPNLADLLPNSVGILIESGASDNQIGGTTPGLGNDIGGNAGAGIAILNPALSPGNALLGNNIAANGGLGIDLFNDGVTANSGAHQFFPVLTEALFGADRTLIRGSLTMPSAPASTFEVQFFGSTLPDPTSFGEGRLFLGSTFVTTDATGTATFSVPTTGILNGNFVTATAIDTLGNTSEFSAARAVTVGLGQANIAANGRSATFTDADGDLVTVKVSKGSLSQGDFTLTAAGTGSGLQLVALNLSTHGTEFAGASVTITARRSPLGGDGFVNVGHLDATGVNLGAVKIVGDLGRIDAGAGVDGFTALKSLSVQSFGRYLGQTEFPATLPDSRIDGKVGTIAIAGNFIGKALVVLGDVGSLSVGRNVVGIGDSAPGLIVIDGTLAKGRVGGDLLGGDDDGSGRIVAATIRDLAIGGSLIGGAGGLSGTIASGDGGIGKLTIRGSLIGHQTDPESSDSASVTSNGRIGTVSIGGNLIGGAGAHSGFVFGASIGSATVAGSLKGGAAFASGAIESSTSLDVVTVRGSLFGAGGERSGGIYAASSLGRITVTGSLHGASGQFSASIESGGGLASAKIGGDVFAGSGALSGAITATNRIGSVSVFGSLFSVVATNLTLGAVSIGGDHFGVVTARGARNPATSAGALTIASVKIGGDLSGSILAGLDYVTDTWTNPDTIIGPVSVGGDVSGASVSSGVAPGPNGSTADGDDFVPVGGNAAIFSQIVSIIVRGQVGRADFGDHFGFTAQRIGKLQVGATVFPLTAGTDRFDIGLFGNVSLREA